MKNIHVYVHNILSLYRFYKQKIGKLRETYLDYMFERAY